MLSGKRFFATSLSLTLIFLSNSVFAQNYSGNIWYFGDPPQGIIFNKADDSATVAPGQIQAMGQGGGAVAVDPVTMKLLFYTDGSDIYDATHAVMPGSGVNGDPILNQPVAITPDPAAAGRYIIYTNDGSGVIRTSIVDMTAPGNASAGTPPLGAVVAVNQNNTGITNASEAMNVFASGNPLTYYLTYQDVSTNELVVLRVGPSGALTEVARTPLSATITASNISLVKTPDGTIRIAVSPSDANRNVELFQFDPSGHTLSHDGVVINSAGPQGIYDTEWSADGRYLYISKNISGTEGQVYQYDTQNAGISLATVISPPVSASYGLQLGPDGRIYHIYQDGNGAYQVGRIDNPDSVAALAAYDPDPLAIGTFTGRQFSSCMAAQSNPFTVSFEVPDPVCQNSLVSLFPTWSSEPAPTQFFWNFGDTISYDINPSYTFDQVGPQTVILAAIRGQDTAIYQTTINVVALPTDSQGNPLTMDIGVDTVICPGETLTLDVGDDIAAAANVISWSIGGTGQSITVDTAGIYWVTATLTQGGCRLYDARQVELYDVPFQRMNSWYFGDQAGIDFNPDPNNPQGGATAVTDGLMIAPEGAATISNISGDLLLYTNGKELYGVDRATGNHVLIDDDLGGSVDASQSAIIVPHPGDETLYYVFTIESADDKGTDGVVNLNYTLVDIKGGTAGVIVEKNVPLFSPSGERLTAVEGGPGYILLAHELGSNTFWAFPIGPNGIMAPVLSSEGSDHSLYEPGHSEGYMEFSADGSKVAVALSGPENTVEVFDFIDSTLTVANPITITFDEPYDDYMVYGLEFSPGMNKLFVTLVGNSGSVMYEVPVADTLTEQQIQAAIDTLEPMYEGPERLGSIQRGPDGQLHVAVDGAGSLGSVSASEDSLTSTFNLSGFNLGGRTSGLGLPNFVTSFGLGPQEPSAMVSGALCVGSDVTFSADTTSMIDEQMWTVIRLSDNASVFNTIATDTVVQFNTAGQYRATLHMWNRCGLDTVFTQDFEIFPTPAPPTLIPISVLCQGPLTLDADTIQRTGLTYLWSTGDTTKTIAVSQPSIISVTITDANGCSADNSTEVLDGRPRVELGPDLTICQFDSAGNLQTGISDVAEFTWFINGIRQTPDDRSFVPIASGIQGAYEYEVEVLDTLTGCAATDSVTITVNPQPDLETSSDPSSCGGTDGALIIVSNPQGYSFEWFDPNNQVVNDPANVASGTYSIVITDDISGCTQTRAQSVIDDPANFAITSLNAVDLCEGGKASFTLSNVVSGSQIDFALIDNGSGQTVYTIDGYGISDPAAAIETDTVPPGDYTLEVILNGCRQSGNVVINGRPAVSFDLTIVSQCSPNAIVEAVNLAGSDPLEYTFDWRGPNGYNSSVNPADQMTESGDYSVRIEESGLCPRDTTFTLQLYNSPEVTIAANGDGCDGSIVLTAQPVPSGNYTFLWLPANTAGPQLSYNNPGQFSDITVTAVDMATGCRSVSEPQTVNVYEEIVVDVTSTVPCDDGQPIVMTAEGNLPNLLFDWFDAAGLRINAQSTDEFEVDSEGTYRVVGTIQGTDCTGEDLINLVRLPLTPSNLVQFYTYCSEDPVFENSYVEIAASPDFIDYSWIDLESGMEIYNGPVFQVEGGEEGQYVGRFTNAFGCVTTDTVTVDNDCVPVVFAPNAFTPNGDEKNPTFRVFPRYVTDFEIFIYTRWGELIFYADEQDFQWDGRFQGELMPVGTYPYVMRYKSLTDPYRGVIEKRGGVLLLR